MAKKQKHKKLFYNKRTIVIFSIFILIIIILASILIYPFTYGDDGKLAVSVVLDKNRISFNERINATITIKNTGDTKIRLLDTIYTLHLYVEDSNGSKVNVGDVVDLKIPSVFDLITIDPGDQITVTKGIGINWYIATTNITYYIYAILSDLYSNDLYLWLPHWTGEIISNKTSLYVM